MAALPGLNIAEAEAASPPAQDAPVPVVDAVGIPDGAALDDGDLTGAHSVSPFLAKVCRNLIDRLGAEKAVEALVTMTYGNLLDPARYGPITEFSEEDFMADPGRSGGRGIGRGRDRDDRRGGRTRGRRERSFDGPAEDSRGPRPRDPGRDSGKPGGGRPFSEGRKQSAFGNDRRVPGGRRAGGGRPSREAGGMEGFIRVYVGQGRQHGMGPREIASLLMRAGGVPGRMVDEIETKDFCSFATLPADAARRACALSRRDSGEPVIRPAKD